MSRTSIEAPIHSLEGKSGVAALAVPLSAAAPYDIGRADAGYPTPYPLFEMKGG